MGEFPETAWSARLHDAQRPVTRLEIVDDDRGGFIYVAGRFLVTDLAADLLGLDTQPGEYLNVTWPVLVPLGLREYAYVGPPVPMPELVATLRTRAQRDRPPASAAEDYDVALHYVMTGEKSWVPSGHPSGSPEMSDDPATVRSWPDGPPLVAVVDTGLDLGSATGSAYGLGVSYLVIDPDEDSDRLRDPGQVGDSLAAQAGHGTFITWLVGHQSGDRVGVVNVRALDSDGVGSEVQLLTALRRLIEKHPDIPVINLSLGGYTDSTDYSGTDGTSLGNLPDTIPLALGSWIRWFTTTHNQQAVIVCAAGNCDRDRLFWPAADDRVIAVASLDRELVRSSFSNFGPWVDVCASGEEVVADHPHGKVVDEVGNVLDFSGEAAIWSGTSFAAPVVAAEIARRLDEARAAGANLGARDAWQQLTLGLPAYAATAHALGRVWDPRTIGLDPYEG